MLEKQLIVCQCRLSNAFYNEYITFATYHEKNSIKINEQARNIVETQQMIDSVLQWNSKHPDQRITISVELENQTKMNLPLAQDADYVFLSKDFAKLMGWMSKEVAIQSLRKFVKKE